LHCLGDGNVKRGAQAERKTSLSNERLRKRHRPVRVLILFVGEAPPSSGRFFYQADSGLYRAIRQAFVEAFPALRERDFLESFRALNCYLVDLCAGPVDRLSSSQRKRTCRDGEARLSRTLRRLRPPIVITVVRSIVSNVKGSLRRANWSGLHVELPYPGRWHHLRLAFVQALVPLLRENCSRNIMQIAAQREITSYT
jgi:hypothetical protein